MSSTYSRENSFPPPVLHSDAPAEELVGGLVDDVATLRAENTDLHQAMATRAVIERAKGILMMRYSINGERAFAVLVRWSQDTNIKVRVVAQALVEVIGGEPGPSECDAQTAEAIVAQLRRMEPSVEEAQPGRPRSG